MTTQNVTQPTKRRIVEQTLMPNGIWTVWEGGYGALLPYKIDKDGKEYADLFPNDK